jgi:hypothetical protein
MFDERQVIGHGKVYRGVLKKQSHNVQVAVKRCMTIDEQQKEFSREMLILSQVNHKKSSSSSAAASKSPCWCTSSSRTARCSISFTVTTDGTSPWPLACGARTSPPRHWPTSIPARPRPSSTATSRPTNIPLDGDYRAKVSDFGASILAPTDKSRSCKERVDTSTQSTCRHAS